MAVTKTPVIDHDSSTLVSTRDNLSHLLLLSTGTRRCSLTTNDSLFQPKYHELNSEGRAELSALLISFEVNFRRPLSLERRC